MLSRLLILVALLAALLSSGCMTMFVSKTYPVKVTAGGRPGVQVRGDNGVTISTPGELLLARDVDHELFVIGPDGAPVKTVRIESRNKTGNWVGSILMNGAAWGWWSLGIGAVIGVGSDVASGSLKGLPDVVDVDALPAAVAHAPAVVAPPALEEAPRSAPPPAVGAGDAFDRISAPAFCSGCGRRFAAAEAFCSGCGAKR